MPTCSSSRPSRLATAAVLASCSSPSAMVLTLGKQQSSGWDLPSFMNIPGSVCYITRAWLSLHCIWAEMEGEGELGGACWWRRCIGLPYFWTVSRMRRSTLWFCSCRADTRYLSFISTSQDSNSSSSAGGSSSSEGRKNPQEGRTIENMSRTGDGEYWETGPSAVVAVACFTWGSLSMPAAKHLLKHITRMQCSRLVLHVMSILLVIVHILYLFYSLY